jgi:4'-phosphopantetheinyl transferase
MKVLFDKLIIGQDFPLLNKGEIHLWRVALHPPEVILTAAHAALSDFERNRLEFFEFEQVKRSYTVSQGILRILLAHYLSLPVESIELGRHAKGKPFCKNDEGLFFNMSNSGGLCVFAFSRDTELGIDLECLRPLPDLDELIAKNFSTGEQAYIRKPGENALWRFFFFWTIKESYLKAIGEGMRIEPQKLEFSIQQNRIRLLEVHGFTDYHDWNFEEIPFSAAYVRTLTYQGNGIRFSDFEIVGGRDA